MSLQCTAKFDGSCLGIAIEGDMDAVIAKSNYKANLYLSYNETDQIDAIRSKNCQPDINVNI